jgi:hypothetical protein
MSNKLITINKNFNKDANFWIENPQLALIKPFALLYNRDKTKDKNVSSKEMWSIFFLACPDESENKLYRIPIEERKLTIKELYFPDIKYDDALFTQCVDEYPFVCMSAVERTVKESKDFLIRRANFLKTAEYNIETMKEIDNAVSKSLKIYEDFAKIEALFDTSKKEQVARGNRKLTLSEKQLI